MEKHSLKNGKFTCKIAYFLVNEEPLQLHAVYKKLYFVLQVMRESVLGTYYMRCVESSHDKNHYHMSNSR